MTEDEKMRLIEGKDHYYTGLLNERILFKESETYSLLSEDLQQVFDEEIEILKKVCEAHTNYLCHKHGIKKQDTQKYG